MGKAPGLLPRSRASSIDASPSESLAYDKNVEQIRQSQYPMLRDITYLDHAGTTLPSKALMNTFSQQMKTTLIGNPHSSSSTLPNAAHQVIETTRLKVLHMLNASPEHFEVVWVANATAGIKLVAEAFSGYEHGFDYVYHRDCHTSLVGVRELAKSGLCLESDDDVENWIAQDVCDRETKGRPLKLFSYPGQSNMNGRRLPIAWPALLRVTKKTPATFTLFDIAALASTGVVDLSNHTTAPDFLVMSFYKIFGFPDLGALIVRKEAAHVFDHRKYFGGGTTGMITCRTSSWHTRKDASLAERLEDGTGPTHSILALNCAIDVHNQIFGSQLEVSKHTSFLARHLYECLSGLKHANGRPLLKIYRDPMSTHGDPRTQGATVAFNVYDSSGEVLPSTNVGAIAANHHILLRAGGMCNPVGMAQAVGLSDEDIKEAYNSGFRCGQQDDVIKGAPFGMVRASLGPMSTLKDIEVLVRFMEDYFVLGKTGLARCSFEDKIGFAQLRRQISTMNLRTKKSASLSGSKTTLGSNTIVVSTGSESDTGHEKKTLTDESGQSPETPSARSGSRRNSAAWIGKMLCIETIPSRTKSGNEERKKPNTETLALGKRQGSDHREETRKMRFALWK